MQVNKFSLKNRNNQLGESGFHGTSLLEIVNISIYSLALTNTNEFGFLTLLHI